MISESDLIIIGFAFLFGYISDNTNPQLYHYEDEIVNVYKKYQCPKNCKIDHHHFVYFNSHTNGIVIDKSLLGKKINKKKSHRKK